MAVPNAKSTVDLRSSSQATISGLLVSTAAKMGGKPLIAAF